MTRLSRFRRWRCWRLQPLAKTSRSQSSTTNWRPPGPRSKQSWQVLHNAMQHGVKCKKGISPNLPTFGMTQLTIMRVTLKIEGKKFLRLIPIRDVYTLEWIYLFFEGTLLLVASLFSLYFYIRFSSSLYSKLGPGPTQVLSAGHHIKPLSEDIWLQWKMKQKCSAR